MYKMLSISTILIICLFNEYNQNVLSFIPQKSSNHLTYHQSSWGTTITTACATKPRGNIIMNSSNRDDEADVEGQNLAAEFFKKAQSMGIQGNDLDYDEDDEGDDDDEEEDDARNIPVSEVNAFRGVDEGGVGKLAGNVTFTNKELYDSLKERVLESPSAFTSLLSAPDEDDESDGDAAVGYQQQSTYKPPSTVPDPELTAGEVITLVLQALLNNDIPEPNTGIKLLFSYSSPSSMLGNPAKAPTVDQYADFLKTSEYNVLFNHDGNSIIVDKMDYSYDKKKAFATIRLKKTGTTTKRDFTTVNFILSTKGKDDDDVWLIDSILIRPEGMRRGK